MTGRRGLHRDAGRLLVADLADEDHVGVAAQNRSQAACEREAGGRIDLDLGGAVHLILDGILDRHQDATGFVEQIERRVEGRGLAAPGRSCREQNAVRLLGELAERVERFRRHPQLVESDRSSAPIEQAEDDRLPVEGRDGRDPEVELALFEAHADPPILGRPALGDVQLREQLDARDHGGLKPLRWAGQLAQHAVHAEAGGEPLPRRLQMNVRGTGVMSFTDQEVHEPDDGRLVREVAGVGELVVARVGGGPQVRAQVLDQLDDGLRGGERTADALEQLLLRDRDQLERDAIG